MAERSVKVRQAQLDEQGELIDQEEHCSMDAADHGGARNRSIVGRSGSRRPADGRSTP